MFIVIKSTLHTNNLKTILAIIIPTVIFALTGVLILKPLLLILGINVDQITFIPLYRLIYLLISYLVAFVIVKLLKYYNLNIVLSEDFKLKNTKLIIINLLMGFITIGFQLTITTFYTDILPVYITLLSFLSLFAYFFTSFYSLTRTMQLQITSENLKISENYNQTLSILYDNVKAFKHDFDNIIFTIGGYVNTNDITGLSEYYKSLENDCLKVNNVALLNPTLINNPGIYNLLTAKYQKATDSNVEIKLEFFFDLNKLEMPVYDFSRMLGILIDNAIEAASNTNEKLVKILFRDSQTSRVQIIKIENSYNNKNIDKNTIFQKGVTEKENHLGMGLWEVSQIIKRNNNIKLITEPTEAYFKQTLEIYY